MLQAGDVVDAVVCRIEQYGAYFKHGNDSILVMIPDISWEPIRHPSAVLAVGDEVRMKILRFNPRDKVYVASIRELHPESNPYLRIATLPAGSRLRGKVRSMSGGGRATVALDAGGWGSIDAASTTEPLKPGDTIDVVVDTVNPEAGLLHLKIAPPDET